MTEISLELCPNLRVTIDLDEYLGMSERSLARFYRQHVSGAGRKEAKSWATRQAQERARSISGEGR